MRPTDSECAVSDVGSLQGSVGGDVSGAASGGGGSGQGRVRGGVSQRRVARQLGVLVQGPGAPGVRMGQEASSGAGGSGNDPHVKALRHEFEFWVVKSWVALLEGPSDWGQWPLGHRSSSPGFLLAVEREGLELREVARVGSLVACGHPRLEEFEPMVAPVPVGPLDEARKRGAIGWVCNIAVGEGGYRLFYWVYPSGMTGFEALLRPGEQCPR